MRIAQAADILDVSESTMREMCRRSMVKAAHKRVRLKFLLSNKSGTVSKVERHGYVWEIDGADLRRLKRQRNRG